MPHWNQIERSAFESDDEDDDQANNVADNDRYARPRFERSTRTAHQNTRPNQNRHAMGRQMMA